MSRLSVEDIYTLGFRDMPARERFNFMQGLELAMMLAHQDGGIVNVESITFILDKLLETDQKLRLSEHRNDQSQSY